MFLLRNDKKALNHTEKQPKKSIPIQEIVEKYDDSISAFLDHYDFGNLEKQQNQVMETMSDSTHFSSRFDFCEDDFENGHITYATLLRRPIEQIAHKE